MNAKLYFIFQLAKLSPDDMNAVNNMTYLGGLATKKTSGGSKFSLKFDTQKVKFFKVGRDLLPQFYCS